MKILACVGLLCIGVVAGMAAVFIAEKQNGGSLIDYSDYDDDDWSDTFDDDDSEDDGSLSCGGLSGDTLEV